MHKLLLLLISTVTSFTVFSQKNDTTAIKALLQKESDTRRSGDVKGHANCWYIQP